MARSCFGKGFAMRLRRNLPALLLLLAGPACAAAAGAPAYDGHWLTTVSCPQFHDALGYAYSFVSEVRDGRLHGLHGKEGEAGSLQVDGRIEDDGTSHLLARGLTGSKDYVPGRETPRGTEYAYHVDARFDGNQGSGRRVEGRPCSLQFDRQW
jgi:hypothetical protein